MALVGDGDEATWWNPAALGFAGPLSAAWTHAKLVPGLADDVRYDHYSAAAAAFHRVGVGISGTRLDYGEGFGTERSHSGSVGVQIVPGLAVGATLKHIKVAFNPFVAGTGNGYDIGLLGRVHALPSMTLAVGATVQNLGKGVEFPGEFDAFPLSRNLKLGIAAAGTLPSSSPPLAFGYAAVVDYNQSLLPGDSDFHTWNGGFECRMDILLVARVALRAGYYYDPDGQIKDPTYGAGARVAGFFFDVGRIPQARDSGLPYVTKVTGGFALDDLLRVVRRGRSESI